MKEIWKDVPNYEGIYQASNIGKIYSLLKNRILNGTIDRGGYVSMQLKKDGIYWSQRRSRIVYRTFKDSTITELDIVHHKDENKLNDCIDNLEKTNRSEHKKIHNEIGINTRFKKIHTISIKEVIVLYEKMNMIKIAKIYNCNQKTIERMIKSYYGGKSPNRFKHMISSRIKNKKND